MMKQLLSIGVLAAATLTSHAALTWTGAGDGTSLYSEANWLDDNGLVPGADEINAGTAVTAATGGIIQIAGGTGGPANFGGNFDLGVGNDLEVGGGKTLATSGSGIRVDGTSTANHQLGTISGASTVRATFTLAIDWTLGGASTLRLNGGGSPLNVSTVNILDTNSLLLFEAETYADFANEHASKVTFNGVALVFGAAPFAVEPGDNALATAYNGAAGVQITTVVPEPSAAALLGLGGLALILRRRK